MDSQESISPPTVTAILLAAGSAARMNAEKLRLPYKGRTVFERALAPLTQVPAIHDILVVMRPDFAPPALPANARRLVNAGHAEGMGSSLRLGVAHASPSEACLIALADMPEVSPRSIDDIVAASRRFPDRIIVPTHAGQHGHPVLFPCIFRDELLRLTGDKGARTLLQAHASQVEYLPIDHAGVLFDLDTPADLQRHRLTFADEQQHRAAVAALTAAGVYFETGWPAAGTSSGPAVGGPPWVEYYHFDEERVRGLRLAP